MSNLLFILWLTVKKRKMYDIRGKRYICLLIVVVVRSWGESMPEIHLFYDAIIIGRLIKPNGTATSNGESELDMF